MQVEVVMEQGRFSAQNKVIVRNEKGEEVYNKPLKLTSSNVVRKMGVDEDQIAMLDAARRANYAKLLIPQSKRSNNQPLIQENLLPPKNYQRVAHFTPPRAANPEFSNLPTPPKKFPKMYVKDEEFPMKEEKEDDEFGFRAKPYLEDSTTTSKKPYHLSPQTLFKTPPKMVSRGFDLLNSSNNDLPGYENMGSVSCFCNAVFRALISLPVLEHALLEKQLLWEKCEQDQVALNTGLVRAFQAYRNRTRFSPSRELLPRLPRFHKSYSQEDAHEFLLALLDACETELIQSKVVLARESIPTHQVFSSTMEKTLCCSACNKARKTEDETFLVHSLGIPTTYTSKYSLQDLLCESLCSETVEFTCEQCNKVNVQFTIASKFKTAPPVLALHLKRHEKSMGGLIRKNFTAVDIPLVLEIGREFQCGDTNMVLRYELCSMILHAGSTPRSGHYTAIGRRPDLKQSWLMFDDMRISSVSESSFAAICAADAYLYFYSLAAT